MAALHPTIDKSGHGFKLDMGAVTGEGVNIDTLKRSGIFTANVFAGTLPPGVKGGILFNIQSLVEVGILTSRNNIRWANQVLFPFETATVYTRHNEGSQTTPDTNTVWGNWIVRGGGSTDIAGQYRIVIGQSLAYGGNTDFYMPFDGFIFAKVVSGNKTSGGIYVDGNPQALQTGPDSGYGTMRSSLTGYGNLNSHIQITLATESVYLQQVALLKA